MEDKKIIKVLNGKGELVGVEYGDKLYLPESYDEKGIDKILHTIQEDQPDFYSNYVNSGNKLYKKTYSDEMLENIAAKYDSEGLNDRLKTKKRETAEAISSNMQNYKFFDFDDTDNESDNEDDYNDELGSNSENETPIEVIYDPNEQGQIARGTEQTQKETKTRKRKRSFKLDKKKSAILAGAGIAFVAAVAGIATQWDNITSFFNKNKAKDFAPTPASNSDVATSITTTEDALNNLAYSKEQLNQMTFEQLSNLLNEGTQKNSWELMNNVQSDMNTNTLGTIKDEDGAQLYLNAKETLATYVMFNTNTLESQDFIETFVNSGLLNATEIRNDYTKVWEVMTTYYSRATKRSGIAALFTDEAEKNLVEKYEDLWISYNNAKTRQEQSKVAEELISFVKEINNIDTENEQMDASYKSMPEAVGYINITANPMLQANREIESLIPDDKDYDNLCNQLKNIAETVICDNQYSKLDELVEMINSRYQGKELDSEKELNDLVVKELPRAMDAVNVKVSNRDVEFNTKRIYESTNTYSNSNKYTSTNKTTTTSKTQITREEAVKEFGEPAVQKAEEAAKKEVEASNTLEEERKRGVEAGYAYAYTLAYNCTATYGTRASVSTETSGSAAYKEGYAQGVAKAIELGYQDGIIEYNARKKAEAENSAVVGTITEKPVDPSTQTPNTNNGEESYVPGQENTTPVETPVENTQTPSTPEPEAPSSTPNTSVVETPVKPEDTKPEQGEEVWVPTEEAVVEAPAASTVEVVETPVVETPVVEAPVASIAEVVETPAVEAPVETPVVETPAVETPSEPEAQSIIETIIETPVASALAGYSRVRK